jgi:hypothetical protein
MITVVASWFTLTHNKTFMLQSNILHEKACIEVKLGMIAYLLLMRQGEPLLFVKLER